MLPCDSRVLWGTWGQAGERWMGPESQRTPLVCGSCALYDIFQSHRAPTFQDGMSSACPSPCPRSQRFIWGKNCYGFQLHARGRACSITPRRDGPWPHSATASKRWGEAGRGQGRAGVEVSPHHICNMGPEPLVGSDPITSLLAWREAPGAGASHIQMRKLVWPRLD